LRRSYRVRVAAAVATQRIRPKLDETIDYHQRDRLAEHTYQHDCFAHSYQQASVHRVIDMPATAAGR